VRALSAEKLLEGDSAKDDVRVALSEARRAVRFFRVADFNPCELPVLLDDALFAAANEIVTEEHGGAGLTCEAAKPA